MHSRNPTCSAPRMSDSGKIYHLCQRAFPPHNTRKHKAQVRLSLSPVLYNVFSFNFAFRRNSVETDFSICAAKLPNCTSDRVTHYLRGRDERPGRGAPALVLSFSFRVGFQCTSRRPAAKACQTTSTAGTCASALLVRCVQENTAKS